MALLLLSSHTHRENYERKNEQSTNSNVGPKIRWENTMRCGARCRRALGQIDCQNLGEKCNYITNLDRQKTTATIRFECVLCVVCTAADIYLFICFVLFVLLFFFFLLLYWFHLSLLPRVVVFIIWVARYTRTHRA